MRTAKGLPRRSIHLAALATLLSVGPAAGGCASSRQERAPAPPTAARATEDPPLSPAEIEAHIRFLADDLLGGRGVGSAGIAIAALYHEAHFRRLGLEPAFGAGYRQPLELRGSSPDPAARLRLSGASGALDLSSRDDVILGTHREDTPEAVSGELVYGGYLIDAPGRSWDDIKGMDLRGKVLLVEVNEPGNRPGGIFDGRAMTYYGRWTYKFEHAAALGAAGVLIIHDTTRAGYGWDVVRRSWSTESFFVPGAQRWAGFQGWVSRAAAARILRLAGQEHAALLARAEQASFRPHPLGLRAEARQRSRFRTVTAENVAAILRGPQPAGAPRRHIVISAHYDHLGRAEEGSGEDRIYNGAVDNSSASAALLALATHFASRHPRPPVDLIFLAATAEEQGLLGSAEFVRRMPVPATQVLANLNFEMTNVWGETRDVYAIGARHSTLDATCRQAARRLGLTYTAERDAEQGFFYRSDQLSFAKAGIPSAWLHEGIVSRGAAPDHVQRMRQAYRQQHYHKPSDDVTTLAAQWDLRGTAQIASWAAAIIWLLAEDESPPQFHPTSAFHGARSPAAD